MATGTLPPSLAAAADRAPVPHHARVGLERLVEAEPDLADRLAGDRALLDRVLAVVSASRSLTRFITADPSAVDVLADLDRRLPPDCSDQDALVRWKQLEFLRIAGRDLSGVDDLPAVGGSLAALGADVLGAALTLVDGGELAIIGMGKLGGRELNYASDIDVLFVGDGETDALQRTAREVLAVAGKAFRVDANLRPEGRDGPLVRSLDSYRAYWERWAQPWEFQALLKARAVAGAEAQGRAFDEAAAEQLWSRRFSADDLRQIRDMKQRAEGEVARRGLTEREIKRGRGGIRDVEFSVQLLQLVHGRLDPALRSPTTLDALDELAGAGYVDPADAAPLADAYRFLRTVEHRLQLEEEQQVHTVPASRERRAWLARVLGYRGTPRAGEVDQFDADLARHQQAVRSIHETLYFRPLLEAFASADATLSPEAVAVRLEAFGFRDTERTRQAVNELTRGLTRSSRLMQQLLPLLLDWLSRTPDPDQGLLTLRHLASGPERVTPLVNAFRESPEAAQRLCQVIGTSRLLGETLARNPDLIERLPDAERLATKTHEELVASSTAAISWRRDRAERQEALRRWRARNLFGIGARDVLGWATVEQVGADLTGLADATLETALSALEPTVPFAVVTMGRYGGRELSYASDLDVLFVYDGDGASDFEEAVRLATQLLRFVAGSTPAERIYEIDAGLRPEGKQGSLARSLDAYRTYYESWALTWERQAMVRARPVTGDLAVAERLLQIVEPYVWVNPLPAEDVREIRRMKARIEQERIPPGEDPEFHLKLGKGSLSDVEFTVQLLQLQHGVRGAGTMEALGLLREGGALGPEDAERLAEVYRFCERTRNRWFLVNSQPDDSLPQQPEELARLARALGTTATDLRNEYRRVTRQARNVVERVFYGRE